MLTKLMKYDMRYMARILPWIYLGVLMLSLLTSGLIILTYQQEFFAVLLMFAVLPFYIGIIAVAISGTIIMAVRMYQNLYSGEGYLTFTLPVEKKSIINSKILVSAIWTLFGILATIIIIAIPVCTFFIMEGNEVFSGLSLVFSSIADIITQYPGYSAAVIVLLILSAIGVIFYQPTMLLLSFTIGQTFNKARVLASIGIFYGISYAIGIISGIVSSLITVVFGYMKTVGGVDMNYIMTQGIITLAVMAFTYIACSVGSYLITCRIVEKKLNLT